MLNKSNSPSCIGDRLMRANGRQRLTSGPMTFFYSRARTLIIAALAAFLLALSGPNAASAETIDVGGDASAFIDHLGKRVIELLSNPRRATKKKIKEFRKIFSNALEMDLIARQVLGRHWRTATEAQRAKYNHLFGEYVVQIYAAQFSSYSGESFDVLKEQSGTGSDRIVKTRIIRDTGEITHVDFRVRKSEDRFRVVDVAIRGVSLLVAKRSEFDAIIRRQGLNGLLDLLEERVGKSEASTDPFIRLAKDTFKTLETLVTFGKSSAPTP